MKKFLSLLLAMIMSLSLVTISAGATEYEDLTDKDELGPQYQEAVAVLNKIGVITGYDDGSFRPDVKLTRGAAAKIIVSLLIGPEAATNLPNNYAPYPDVPTGHTFAGVISYCKTRGIINGYGDGTFKPANDLTGYAFAKMLLGALGYDAQIEGFVDTGWTMNVLSRGQEATLFDRLDFHGSEAVTRKDAALMALNTLKATVVEYNKPMNITVTGDQTNVVVSGGQQYSYKTSNQDWARNILPQRRDIANTTTSRADYNTVEFAEEHFVDLRLPHDKYDPTADDYGRPSAEWSYRKLSIGKFPLVADKEYTAQVAHDIDTVTPASKIRALELNGYKVERAASITPTGGETKTRLWINGYGPLAIDDVSDIADYTDNGTLVQVYVDNNGSDFITDVVVVKSQLMTVKRVGSDYVSLELYKDGKGSDGGLIYGFNQEPINKKINNVEVNDDYYEFLSGLKANDFVVVEPVSVDHGNTDYDVGHVYAPETVKGALNGVPDRFGSVNVGKYTSISVDVAGTTYKVSLWNKDLTDIDPDVVRVTKKDVTLTLDRYGYALFADDVGSIDGWLIVANYRQSIVNGILVTFANGWDLDGNDVSLNIGARAGVTNWTTTSDDVWDQNALPRIGSLVKYTNDTQSNTGEWELSQTNNSGVFNVFNGKSTDGTDYYIRANSSAVTVENAVSGSALRDDHGDGTTRTLLMDDGIKFIYVTSDDSGELDTIEIRTARTRVDNDELTSPANFAKGQGHNRAQAAVDWKSGEKVNSNAAVKAVVIKQDNSDATYRNVLYVVDYEGSAMRDANGQMVQGYKVAMLDSNGKVVIQTIYAYRTNLVPGNFARFTKATHDDHEDDFYTLRNYVAPQVGKGAALLINQRIVEFKNANKNLMVTTNTTGAEYNIRNTHNSDRNTYTELTGGAENNDTFANMMTNLRGAQWVDLSNYKYDIDDADDLKKAMNPDDGTKNDVYVTLMFNDDLGSDNFRSVYMIIVNRVTPAVTGAPIITGNAVAGTHYTLPTAPVGGWTAGSVYTITVLDPDITIKVDGVEQKPTGNILNVTLNGTVRIEINKNEVTPPTGGIDIAVTGTAGQTVTFATANADGTVGATVGTATVGETIKLPANSRVVAQTAAGYTPDVRNAAGERLTTAFIVTAGTTVNVYTNGTGTEFVAMKDMNGEYVLSVVPANSGRAAAASLEEAAEGELVAQELQNNAQTGPFYKVTLTNGTLVLLYGDSYFGVTVLKFRTGTPAASIVALVNALNSGIRLNPVVISKTEFDAGYTTDPDEPNPPTPSDMVGNQNTIAVTPTKDPDLLAENETTDATVATTRGTVLTVENLKPVVAKAYGWPDANVTMENVNVATYVNPVTGGTVNVRLTVDPNSLVEVVIDGVTFLLNNGMTVTGIEAQGLVDATFIVGNKGSATVGHTGCFDVVINGVNVGYFNPTTGTFTSNGTAVTMRSAIGLDVTVGNAATRDYGIYTNTTLTAAALAGARAGVFTPMDDNPAPGTVGAPTAGAFWFEYKNDPTLTESDVWPRLAVDDANGGLINDLIVAGTPIRVNYDGETSAYGSYVVMTMNEEQALLHQTQVKGLRDRDITQSAPAVADSADNICSLGFAPKLYKMFVDGSPARETFDYTTAPEGGYSDNSLHQAHRTAIARANATDYLCETGDCTTAAYAATNPTVNNAYVNYVVFPEDDYTALELQTPGEIRLGGAITVVQDRTADEVGFQLVATRNAAGNYINNVGTKFGEPFTKFAAGSKIWAVMNSSNTVASLPDNMRACILTLDRSVTGLAGTSIKAITAPTQYGAGVYEITLPAQLGDRCIDTASFEIKYIGLAADGDQDANVSDGNKVIDVTIGSAAGGSVIAQQDSITITGQSADVDTPVAANPATDPSRTNILFNIYGWTPDQVSADLVLNNSQPRSLRAVVLNSAPDYASRGAQVSYPAEGIVPGDASVATPFTTPDVNPGAVRIVFDGTWPQDLAGNNTTGTLTVTAQSGSDKMVLTIPMTFVTDADAAAAAGAANTAITNAKADVDAAITAAGFGTTGKLADPAATVADIKAAVQAVVDGVSAADLEGCTVTVGTPTITTPVNPNVADGEWSCTVTISKAPGTDQTITVTGKIAKA